MENSFIQTLSYNFMQILQDEIALNGLEGIGTEQLWKYYEKRISTLLTESNKTRLWTFIVSCEGLTFYELPEPIEPRDIVDRFTIIDDESGHLNDPVSRHFILSQ